MFPFYEQRTRPIFAGTGGHIFRGGDQLVRCSIFYTSSKQSLCALMQHDTQCTAQSPQENHEGCCSTYIGGKHVFKENHFPILFFNYKQTVVLSH